MRGCDGNIHYTGSNQYLGVTGYRFHKIWSILLTVIERKYRNIDKRQMMLDLIDFFEKQFCLQWKWFWHSASFVSKYQQAQYCVWMSLCQMHWEKCPKDDNVQHVLKPWKLPRALLKHPLWICAGQSCWARTENFAKFSNLCLFVQYLLSMSFLSTVVMALYRALWVYIGFPPSFYILCTWYRNSKEPNIMHQRWKIL